MDMIAPQYRVLSLRVAADPQRTVGTNFFFDSMPADADLPMPQDYIFWIIEGNGRLIVVDTCFNQEASERRGRRMLRPVERHLADLGIAAEDVTDVIMTHLHWDHAGNIGLFPNARFHVQADELAFCTGRAMLHRGVSKIYNREDVQAFLVPLFEGRVALLKGDAILFPGISVSKVGGHTPGSMTVNINTQRGHIVLASDAAHFYANFANKSPFPILDSFPQALEAFDIIHRLAGGSLAHVIPGHDPLIMSVFPAHADFESIALLHQEPLIDPAVLIRQQFAARKVPA